jgi:hypothetical protein
MVLAISKAKAVIELIVAPATIGILTGIPGLTGNLQMNSAALSKAKTIMELTQILMK